MALRCLVLLAAVNLLPLPARACNRKELTNYIVTHYDETVEPKCRTAGQTCKFDRNCCEKLECIMTTDDNGVTSVCELRLVFEDYMEMTAGPQWSDYVDPETEEEDEDGGKAEQKSLQELQNQHDHLINKFKLLKQLRNDYSRIELNKLKSEKEMYEISKLKELKKQYDKDQENKLKELTKIEELKLLEDFEKKEVNSTLIRERKLADLYKEMLNDALVRARAMGKNT